MAKTTQEEKLKRFISILSDYGFKVTFGNETDTLFLRKAIQLLIKSSVPIKEVQFEKNEVSALTKGARNGIFDLTCIDETGKVYIVEMQLTNFKHFIHRGKFYAFHRLNKMVKKGKYLFNDLKQIYLISFLAGKTYKTKEFHQIGTLKNQHGELMDNQITHVSIELGKWDKKEFELKTDLDKLLYIMKFTETATIDEELPKFSSEEWMEKMIKELDKRNMDPDKLIAIEMALAREGSMLAAQMENIEAAVKKERVKSRKRLDFERKKFEQKAEEDKKVQQKLAEEKKLAEQKLAESEQKLAEEKKLAEQKLAEEKKLAEQKLAEEKKLAEQKLAEEKKLAEQKLVEEKKLTAKNLLALKTLTNEQIVGITGLSIATIKQLAKNLK